METFTEIIALFIVWAKQTDWYNLLSEMVQSIVGTCGNKSRYSMKEGSRENEGVGEMSVCVSG